MSQNIWDETNQKLIKTAGNVNLDDSVVSEESTWSSSKIHDSLVDIESALDSKQNFTKIDEHTKTIEELFNEQDDITCAYQSRFDDGVGNDFGFITIQKTNAKYGNVTFHSNNGVYQNRINNGIWSGWLRLVTTDDIISETKAPVGQVTINANATYSNTAVNVEKSGYKVLMTTVSTTGHNTVYCYNSSYADGKMTIQLRNNSASNITVTPYVTVVYKKA